LKDQELKADKFESWKKTGHLLLSDASMEIFQSFLKLLSKSMTNG
jgi:hypothetical protein